MAEKYAGRFLTVSLDGGSSNFPNLKEFGAFGSSRTLIDATAYGDDWNDYVTGLQDGDEVAYVIEYDPEDDTIQDFVDAYDNTEGRITLTVEHTDSGFTADISCIINAMRRESALDGLFQLSGTVKIVNPGVVVGS